MYINSLMVDRKVKYFLFVAPAVQYDVILSNNNVSGKHSTLHTKPPLKNTIRRQINSGELNGTTQH